MTDDHGVANRFTAPNGLHAAKAHACEVMFDGQLVTVRRRGLSNVVAGRAAEVDTVPVRQITTIRLSPASVLERGTLSFYLADGRSVHVSFRLRHQEQITNLHNQVIASLAHD